MPAGYSGTPLVRKLGIKPATSLLLIQAPPDFERALIGLPDGVRLLTRVAGTADLIVWFTRRRSDLEARADRVIAAMGAGLWIAWPKRASGVRTDVTEDVIRACCLPRGLVDYKVCAIDEVWSGLKLARRKAPSSRRV